MYFNKILVTTDFSEEASLAFPLAKHEAALSNSELTILNVIGEPALPVGFGNYAISSEVYESVINQATIAAKDKLRDIAASYFEGMNAQLVALRHKDGIAQFIADYAKDNGFGLIVAASQGKGAIKRLGIGSTIENLARRSPCPILVVARDETNIVAPRGPYKNILVTTDFSDDAERAFKYAAYEAKMNKADVTIGYVLGELMPEFLDAEGVWSDFNLDEVQNNYLEGLKSQVQKYADEHFPTINVHAGVILRKRFSISASIVAMAKERKCDLIVISTHGAGGSINLIGGIAERVIRHSHCPVMVVPKST